MKKLIIACALLLSFVGLLFLLPASLVKTQDVGKSQDNKQAETPEETPEQTQALNVAIDAIVDRVENNILLKEPGSKLKTKTLYKVRSQVAPGTRGAFLKWKTKKGYVSVNISLTESEEGAHRNFHERQDAIALGVIKPIQGIGDEAVVVTSGVKDPSTGVYFRKGNILVDVYASNKELALRFAPYVVDQLE